MRTIIDIPDAQIKFLNDLSKKKKVSRAEIVRAALNNYIANCKKDIERYESAFCSWENSSVKDSVSYQQKLRDEGV